MIKMCSESSEILFRPWDCSSEMKDDKTVLASKLSHSDKDRKDFLTSSSRERQLLNNNRSVHRRHHHMSHVRVKSEPSEAVMEPVMAGERADMRDMMDPLSLAMRGLVSPQHLNHVSDHVSHLMHVSRVRAACQLQLAVASVTGSGHDKKTRPKKYKCEECGAGFSNNGQLRGHLRIHTGERPYQCSFPECGKTFTRNEELTRHKRIHTGVKPFSCPLPGCGKPFGRKDHLKKHMKTHERFPGSPYHHLGVLPPPLAMFHQQHALSQLNHSTSPW